MKPKGKCFAKKCEDCNWWQSWDITETLTGLRKMEYKCSFQVILETLPRLIGSIDGLQGGVNESRNRSMETKESVNNIGHAMVKVLENIKKSIDGGSECITITEN